MKKLKTSKSMAKRFRVTRSGKILRRAVRQNHFNAKAPGKQVRAKRHMRLVNKTEVKYLLRKIPY